MGAGPATLGSGAVPRALEAERGGTIPPLDAERVAVPIWAPSGTGAGETARSLDGRIEAENGEDRRVEVRLVAADRV